MLTVSSEKSSFTKIFSFCNFFYLQVRRILDLSLKLRNYATIYIFFISCVIISLYLSNAMRSFSWDVFSVPNFLSQNPLLLFRFLPTFHWFLLETHQRQIYFRRLRFSKVARFFFVFMTKSSVYLSSFYSSTLLSMSSSFLLTSSTLSLWFLSFLPLKYKFSCPSNQ